MRNIAVKAKLFPEYPRLKDLYERQTGEVISRQKLINRIHHLATEEAVASFNTLQPDITGVTIKLHRLLPPVHVLLRHESAGGALRDMRLSPSNRGHELDELLCKMAKTGEKSTAHLVSQRSSSAVNAHLQALWWRRKDEFKEIHRAMKTIPEYARLTGPKFLMVLHEMVNEVRSLRTRVQNVEEVGVTVPLPNGRNLRFGLLRRVDSQGQIADIHLLPTNENEKEVLLNQMDRGAGVSATYADPVRERDYYGTVIRRCRRIWSEIGADFGNEYGAYCRLAGKGKTSGAKFIKYLDSLCNHVNGQPIQIDGKAITRHLIHPDGSVGSVAVLGYHDSRGLGALRKVRIDGADEQDGLRALLKDIEKLRPVTAGAVPPDAPVTEWASASRKKPVPLKRGLKNAARLKQALEVMVQNKACGTRLLEGVEEATGIPARMLTAWVAADGALQGTATELLRLTGYFAVREDLAQLFEALGQRESAERLPPPVTAGLLVKVLTALRNNRSVSTDDLAALTGTSANVIRQLVDSEAGELLLSDTQLRRLPDYGVPQRAQLRACMAVLQPERADALPAPQVPAQALLDDLHEMFYAVSAALQEMRRNRALSAHEAAALVDELPKVGKLTELVARPGAELRRTQEIAARVPGFNPRLAAILEHLLSQLDESRPGDMATAVRPKRGAFGAPVVFVAARGSNDALSANPSGLTEIYKHSPNLVRRPRPYTYDRSKQALRWLSTVVKQQFPGALEIQCYWDAPHRRVWVSSNRKRQNEDIRAFLSEGSLTEVLLDPPEERPGGRAARHVAKLRRALLEKPAQGVSPDVQRLFAAMRQGRFKVPVESFYEDGAQVDLHAERRIQIALEQAGMKLDPRSLGGVMRPCAVCAKVLGLPDSAHRGPAWLSRSAAAYVDVREVIDENVRKGIGSYATLGLNGEPTLSYDTDSDSEVEGQGGGLPEPAKGPDAGPSRLPVLGKRSARERRVDMDSLRMGTTVFADALFERSGRLPKRQATIPSDLSKSSEVDIGHLIQHLEPRLPMWHSFPAMPESPQSLGDASSSPEDQPSPHHRDPSFG